MNRYKKILFQVGILLFVLAICIFVLEQRKQFISIDFSKHYSNNKTIELSGFEESEKWQGNYSYDSERVLEGKTSITLSSWYGKENSIQSDQVTILPPGYVDGYLSVYVPGKQNLSSLVSFTLNLIGEKDQKMEYTFTSLMHVGWNRIPVAIPNWKKITSRSFSIKSKPQAIAEINLDRFWIEKHYHLWFGYFSTHNQSLSLRTIGDRTYLFSTSPELESYTLTTPSFLRRGSVIISLIPEHAKEIRLSLNTTSLKLTGKHMNECILYKNNNAPTTKVLQTASGKDDLYVFIKAEVQGNKVAYSLSNNGVDFESCGSVVSSYKNRIQLFLQGSYLIDSYSAEY